MNGWTAWLIYNIAVLSLIVTALVLTGSMWSFIALFALTSYESEKGANE